MRLTINPPLPLLVRTNICSVQSAVDSLLDELNSSAKFNYISATKCIKYAYKGMHKPDVLLAGLQKNAHRVGGKANLDVARLASKLAFGRNTKVLPIEASHFRYGSERYASYRAPFVFLEDNIVKLYFLQPRKSLIYNKNELALYATIVKKFLLDDQFYGEKVDLEFVELAERSPGCGREVKVYTLEDFSLVSDEEILHHFSIISAALSHIEAEQLIKKVKRPLKDAELPLFS